MGKMKNIERQDSWLSRLTKIGSAGSDRVARTLSELVRANFEIESAKAKLCVLQEIPSLLRQNGKLDLLISIHLGLSGQVSGRSVLVFPWESAERLDRRLWAQIENPPRFLSEVSYTAIKELANVITTSYMMTLEDLIDISMLPSIPDISVGASKTILDSLIFQYNNHEKFLICLSSNFIERKLAIKGTLLIFLVAHSVQTILETFQKRTSRKHDYLQESEYIPNVVAPKRLIREEFLVPA